MTSKSVNKTFQHPKYYRTPIIHDETTNQVNMPKIIGRRRPEQSAPKGISECTNPISPISLSSLFQSLYPNEPVFHL